MKARRRLLPQWLLIFTIAAIPSSALAIEFGVEPYLGYGRTSFNEGLVSDIENYDVALVIGARGGWFLLKEFYLALDYQIHGPIALSDYEYSLRSTLFGGGVSYNTNLFRLWAGYYFLDRFEDANIFTKWTGDALKFTVGVAFRPEVYLNVEYVQHNLKTKKDIAGEAEFNSDLASASTVMLTMSAVLELLKM